MDSGHPDLQRRRLLASLLAAGVSPQVLATAMPEEEYILSAQGSHEQAYGLGQVRRHHGDAQSASTGFRGHGASVHPLKPGIALMYSRRPGDRCVEVDLRTNTVKQAFVCPEGHHLFGHGCFSQDGTILFTSEADFRSGKGKIGIRDSRTYQRIGEYDSHGVGPHEIKLMPDGKTLLVANGGLLTHPKTGRKTLNLDSMESRLSYIDLSKGQQLEAFKVPEDKASIRHIDVASDGTVAIATQVQRAAMRHNELVPLGAVQKPGQALEMLAEPAVLIHHMQDYMGSVAINNRTRIAGFTSPRGNVAAFWHLDEARFVQYHQLHDVCGLGVSNDEQHFVISNSSGQLRFLDANTLQEDKTKRLHFPHMRWDNHLLVTRV
ncbi:MAG TPA: DUF1513 domain-containing protein [Gammaproteobacteria bacterium]|jgi:hypothetical protein|nr:DUF1513 domain-containing protein [Gammaproteobacteria bacterium]